MSKELKLSHEVYEVLDTAAHKYSTTQVSGGGTNAAGGVNPLSSSVTHHSEQELWVKDLDSGRERKFDFRSFNIDARPGHRLLLVRHQPSGRIERIINNNTGDTYAAYGIFNTWANRNAFIHSTGLRLANALFIAVASLIPLLGWVFIGIGHLIGVFTGGLLAGDKLKSGLTRLYNAFMLLCGLCHIWVSLQIWNMTELIPLSQDLFWTVETLFAYFLFPGQYLLYSLVQIGPWWSVSVTLLVYATLATFLINLHHGRRIKRLSQQVNQYSQQQASLHQALS